MARSGPHPASIELSRNERKRLEALAGDEAASDRLRDRARIVLAASAGQSNAEIAQAVGLHPASVRLWRTRWLRDGLEGLQHKTPVAEPGRRMVSVYNRMCRLRYAATCRSVYGSTCRSQPAGSTN